MSSSLKIGQTEIKGFVGLIHAKITTETYYIGFIPGVISMVLGTMLSGIGIYKRQTAQLFKELEV